MSRSLVFDDLMQTIKNSIPNDDQAVVFLESGHFDPRYGVNEFSKKSLEDALWLTKLLVQTFGKKVKIVLGILVDDLGLDCSESVCSIKSVQNPLEDFKDSLPKELEELLASSVLVKRERVMISSEKTCKNRGLLSLKKLIKSDNSKDVILSTENDSLLTKVYFQDSEENNVLLAEFKEAVWKAKCPTIMGQHYIDCFNKIKQRFNHIQKLIIIDWTEMLDYSKVTAGSQAAMKIFKTESLNNNDLEILNVFYCDDQGELYEIKQFNNSALEPVQYL